MVVPVWPCIVGIGLDMDRFCDGTRAWLLVQADGGDALKHTRHSQNGGKPLWGFTFLPLFSLFFPE